MNPIRSFASQSAAPGQVGMEIDDPLSNQPVASVAEETNRASGRMAEQRDASEPSSRPKRSREDEPKNPRPIKRSHRREQRISIIDGDPRLWTAQEAEDSEDGLKAKSISLMVGDPQNGGKIGKYPRNSDAPPTPCNHNRLQQHENWIAENFLREDAEGPGFLTKLMQAGSQFAVAAVVSILLNKNRLDEKGEKAKELILFCLRENRAFALAGLIRGGLRTLDEQALMCALYPRPTAALRSLLFQLSIASVELPQDVVKERGEALFEEILNGHIPGERDAQQTLNQDRSILNWLWDQLTRCGVRPNRESRQKALICLVTEGRPSERVNQMIDMLASERPGEPIIEWEQMSSLLLGGKIPDSCHLKWALAELQRAASSCKAVLRPLSWTVFQQLKSAGFSSIFDSQYLELQDEDEWRRELLHALGCHLRGENSQLFKTTIDQVHGQPAVPTLLDRRRRDQELRFLTQSMGRAFRGRAIDRMDLEDASSCSGAIVFDRIRSITFFANRGTGMIGTLHNLVVQGFELASGPELGPAQEQFLLNWCNLGHYQTLVQLKNGLSSWLSALVDPEDPVLESLLELQIAGRLKNQNGQLLASVQLDHRSEAIQGLFQGFSSYHPRVLNRLIDWMCANEAMPSPERGDLAPWMIVGSQEQRIKWMAQWTHHCSTGAVPMSSPSVVFTNMRLALNYCIQNEIPWEVMADLVRSQWAAPRDERDWTVQALEWLGTELSHQRGPSIHEDELLARVLKMGEDEPHNQIVIDEWLELLEKAVNQMLLRTASQIAQRMARSFETQGGWDVKVLNRLFPLSHIDSVLDLSIRMMRSEQMKHRIAVEPQLIVDLCTALAGNDWALFPRSEEDSRWPLYRAFGSLLGDLCKGELPDRERISIESWILSLVHVRGGFAGQWIGEFDLPPGHGALAVSNQAVEAGICFVRGLWSHSQQGFDVLRAKIGASAIPSREILIACLLEPEELAEQTWELLQQRNPRLFAGEGEADIPAGGWLLVTLGSLRPNRAWEQVRDRWKRMQEICPEFLSQRGNAASRQAEWKALFENAAAAGPSFYEGLIQFALEDARCRAFFQSVEGAPILRHLIDLTGSCWRDVGAWMSEQTRDLLHQELENAVRAGFIQIDQSRFLLWMAMGSRKTVKEALARYPIGDLSPAQRVVFLSWAWGLGFDDSKELLALEPSGPEFLKSYLPRRYLEQHRRLSAIRILRANVPVGQRPWDVLQQRLSIFSKQTIREALPEGLQGGPLQECLQDAERLEALIERGGQACGIQFDSSCLYEAPPCMQVLELDGEQQHAAIRYLRKKVDDYLEKVNGPDVKRKLTENWNNLLQFVGLSAECMEIRSDQFRQQELEANRALLVQVGALLERADWDEDTVLSNIRSLLQDVVCLTGTQTHLQNLVLRIASRGRSGLKEALISRIKEVVLAVFDGESLVPNQAVSALNPQRGTHQKNHLLWLLNPSLQLVPQQVMPDRLSNWVWHPQRGMFVEVPRDLTSLVSLTRSYKSSLEIEMSSISGRLSEVIFSRNPETNRLLFEEEIKQLLEARWQRSGEVSETFHSMLSGLERQRLSTLHALCSSWQTLTLRCRECIQQKLRETGYVQQELPEFLNWLYLQVQSGPRSRQEILNLLDFQAPLNPVETQLLRRLVPESVDAQLVMGNLEVLELYQRMEGSKLAVADRARIIHQTIQGMPDEGQLSEAQRTELWNALCHENKRRTDEEVLRQIQEQGPDDPLPGLARAMSEWICHELGITVWSR
jgi:hypothetical protein